LELSSLACCSVEIEALRNSFCTEKINGVLTVNHNNVMIINILPAQSPELYIHFLLFTIDIKDIKIIQLTTFDLKIVDDLTNMILYSL